MALDECQLTAMPWTTIVRLCGSGTYELAGPLWNQQQQQQQQWQLRGLAMTQSPPNHQASLAASA
jgi:hypothetical protein